MVSMTNATPSPAALAQRNKNNTLLTGGWLGLRIGLDVCGISGPAPGFDPRTIHNVASCYTD